MTNKSHYAYARETDSALVQTPATDGTWQTEKFLFYRGLGNFKLATNLVALGGQRFELTNTNPDPIRSAFLIEVPDDGRSPGRFAQFRDLAGQRELAFAAWRCRL